MNIEFILDKEDIKRINEQNRGSIRNDAEIETALMLGKGKSLYTKIAFLWKAIVIGHPFTDGNKRTAYLVTIRILKKCDIILNKKEKRMIVRQITKIASENITDMKRINRMVRYAIG